ncbi:hypothetical protein QYE76_055195 [Lolium multiflorum]|uniref:Uncharacterized protein n=1 Tax=Lolium multiflorum TaxID=4521 RepID=A0AAD8SZ84_LOLMU|nr:hypothetical protein QYE76_055195 [Lolium multiflorum]
MLLVREQAIRPRLIFAGVEDLRKRLHDAETLSDHITAQSAREEAILKRLNTESRFVARTAQEFQLEEPHNDPLDACHFSKFMDGAREGIDRAKAGLSRLFPYFFPKKEEPATFLDLAKSFNSAEDLGLKMRQENMKVAVENVGQVVPKCLEKMSKRKRNFGKYDDIVTPVAEDMMDELLRMDSEFFVKGSYAEHIEDLERAIEIRSLQPLIPTDSTRDLLKGNAAPDNKDHRVEGDFSSLPEFEDPGASNTGTGSDQAERSKPLVPPVLEKTDEAPPASPNKTSSSAPPKPASPAKGPAVLPPTSFKKPPLAPSSKKFSSRRSTAVTAEQLSGAVQAAVAQPASSHCLTLHVGQASVAISEKLSAQTGRIIELNRGEANLGSLQKYVDEWNLSDMTEATLGLGKDGQPVVDSRGPRNTVQHMYQLKRSMREFDIAWHDVDKNMHGVLDSRKKLFEQLLTMGAPRPHEAYAALQLAHNQCQAEKDKLSLQHQNELQAQKNETAKLKEELIQAGLWHDIALKEAVKAGKVEVEEVKDQLCQELQEEKKLRGLQKQRNDEVQLVQVSHGEIIKDLDDKARTIFPESQERAEAAVAKVWVEIPVSDATF